MIKHKYLILLLVICISLFMASRENQTEKSINSSDWDDEDFAKFSIAESKKIYKVFEDFPDSIFNNDELLGDYLEFYSGPSDETLVGGGKKYWKKFLKNSRMGKDAFCE